MREYPTKKGIDLSEKVILEKMKMTFGNAVVKEGTVISSYPGIKEIVVKSDGKKLFIGATNEEKPQNPEHILKIFNSFLELITGLNTKERKKKLTKV
ncbi:MAG: DUF5611 family protein [Thermoplasmataceae archaeon]